MRLQGAAGYGRGERETNKTPEKFLCVDELRLIDFPSKVNQSLYRITACQN